MDLKSKVGGGNPTRQSVYEMAEVKKAEDEPSEMPKYVRPPGLETNSADDPDRPVLPMIFVGLIVRRWLVQGLIMGGVK